MWNWATKKYGLDFNDRDVEASDKNFILEDVDSKRELLMFGKKGE